ncbi:uncharacterized protein LOC143292897 isoform X1 [Babylonia areolata]|uniref:uncharacterized protein LOC143292897 isoform X1 n=2 Tax=Babylonia areolata TaxID=304850 RepID=UPI003FD1C788
MSEDMAGSGCLRRLQMEYIKFLTEPETGISAGPRLGHQIFPMWDAWIHGPENSPYEGGIFQLQIFFPTAYPFKPPKVIFTTKVLHCNIDSAGRINLDILRDQWSPALFIQRVLLSIRFLLDDPNPDDPLVPELGILLKKDPAEYDRQVREATRQFAIPQVDWQSDDDDV